MPQTDDNYRIPTLLEYLEATFNQRAHEWQAQHLCPLLERFRTEKGLRVMVHGPPQFGKSIIASQRLPAYLLGADPLARVVLACYNETHAIGFGKVVQNLMASGDHRDLFPDQRGFINENDPAGLFSTVARKGLNDGQHSFSALGLHSGFTGKGADILIVDDPYKSPAEADSLIVNESVWNWWSGQAKVRINDDTNVLVMFHRYHQTDLAGRLLKEGGWEYHRFPAIADDNADGSDPTGREPGEVLSPMRTKDFLLEIELNNPDIYLSQFQGRPDTPTGTLIQPAWFQIETTAPRFVRYVRGWDIALTPGGGNQTVGVLLAQDEEDNLWIVDVVCVQESGPDVHDIIIAQVALDPPGTTVAVEKSTASLSIVQDLEKNELFTRVPLEPIQVHGSSGDKYARSLGWVSRAKRGKVKVLHRAWAAVMFEEFRRFKNLKVDIDDHIDAITTGFAAIHMAHGAKTKQKPRITYGSQEYYEALRRNQNQIHRD